MAAIAKALLPLALLGLACSCAYHGENDPAHFSPKECIEGWNAALRPAAPGHGGGGGVRWRPSDRPEPLSSVGLVARSAVLRSGSCEIAFDLGDGQAFVFEVAPGYKYWQDASEGLIWDARGPVPLAAYVDQGTRPSDVCQNGDETLELGDGCEVGADAAPSDVRVVFERQVGREFAPESWWIGTTWRGGLVRRAQVEDHPADRAVTEVAVYDARFGEERASVAIVTVHGPFDGTTICFRGCSAVDEPWESGGQTVPVAAIRRVAPEVTVVVAGDGWHQGVPRTPLPPETVAEIVAALRPVWPVPASR